MTLQSEYVDETEKTPTFVRPSQVYVQFKFFQAKGDGDEMKYCSIHSVPEGLLQFNWTRVAKMNVNVS